ncbi:hypothetical protein LLG07_08415 [bacterium]|nr:hypothetical protein [bacterium]
MHSAYKKNSAYSKRKENLLAREIIVLILFAVLISISILFLFPVVSKNIFYVNIPGSSEILKFPSDVNTEETINKANLFESNNKIQKIKNETPGINEISKLVKGKNYIEIFLNPAATADPGNYLEINLRAKNNDGTDFPKGSLNIKWKYENENNYSPLNQENLRIYIDGFSHDYFNALGENKNWKSGKKISSIQIEVPDVPGVSVTLNEISLNKRSIFPLDSYINRFFKENFNIREINRFLIPAYIGLLFILAMIYSLKLVSKKVLTGKMAFNAALIILLIFSIYFFKNEILNVKSYYDSYRKNILSGNLKDTYLGFYDFEKFISWAGSKIPENENAIVLIRGEQIYIESELAYNLYPRDLKFINISGIPQEKIINEIYNLSADAKVETPDKNSYKYIIVLSEKDLTDSKGLDLKYSYKPDAGLIFVLPFS